MRVATVLLSGFFGLAFAAGAPVQLPQVRSVYLFPMANGLDQYLANRLTNLAVFQVVIDPKKADAVLSDRLGETFETRLDELYSEPAAKPAPEKGQKPADAAKPDDNAAAATPAMNLNVPPPPVSSFGRGKGNIFLVDAHGRSVLWSTYERPRSALPEELDRTAGRIVARLKHDLDRTSARKK